MSATYVSGVDGKGRRWLSRHPPDTATPITKGRSSSAAQEWTAGGWSLPG
jgi:hypothetical protein